MLFWKIITNAILLLLGDMYSRGGGGGGGGPAGPTPPGASGPPKGVNDYPYPSYTPGYQQVK